MEQKKDEILACLVEVSKLQSVIRQRDFLLNYNLCFDITWVSFISYNCQQKQKEKKRFFI